jgi:hypothetical protein
MGVEPTHDRAGRPRNDFEVRLRCYRYLSLPAMWSNCMRLSGSKPTVSFLTPPPVWLHFRLHWLHLVGLLGAAEKHVHLTGCLGVHGGRRVAVGAKCQRDCAVAQ